MKRIIDVMTTQSTELDKIINSLEMLNDGWNIVIENDTDKDDVTDSVRYALKNLNDIKAILLKQKYGFLNQEY